MSLVLPTRCFSCGKELASLYVKYYKTMMKKKGKLDYGTLNDFLGSDSFGSYDNSAVFEEMGVKRICCRINISSCISGDDLTELVFKMAKLELRDKKKDGKAEEKDN